jgi:hypothetical protein
MPPLCDNCFVHTLCMSAAWFLIPCSTLAVNHLNKNIIRQVSQTFYSMYNKEVYFGKVYFIQSLRTGVLFTFTSLSFKCLISLCKIYPPILNFLAFFYAIMLLDKYKCLNVYLCNVGCLRCFLTTFE